MVMTGRDELREQVRQRYARAAITVLDNSGVASGCGCGSGAGSCCGSAEQIGATDAGSCCGPAELERDDAFGPALYSQTDRDGLPLAAVEASLGLWEPDGGGRPARG